MSTNLISKYLKSRFIQLYKYDMRNDNITNFIFYINFFFQ